MGRGLEVTNPIEISILFGTMRITQNYTPSSGNRFLYNFPPGDGQARWETLTVTLTERTSSGAYVANVSYFWQLPIVPLYDVTLGPLWVQVIDDGNRWWPLSRDVSLYFR